MIKKFFGHRFVSATFWMFIAISFLNGGNYLYHLLMARMLEPEQFGVLESLISLFYILAIPLLTMTLVIVKFTSAYKGRGDQKAIYGLYSFLHSKILIFGPLFALGLLLISPLIVQFLHLPSFWLVVMLAGAFFVSLFNVLAKSFLQGLTNFFGMAVANFSEMFTKVSLAVLFVVLGFQVTGAFVAVGISIAIGYVVSRAFLKEIISRKETFVQSKDLLTFTFPVLMLNLAFTSLYTTDILLVRHFFSGVESGYYAALSILGKIIFYAASPILLVMFPLVSEHHAAKKRYEHFLVLSIVFTGMIVSVLTILYFLFPSTVVGLLFGEQYASIVELLGYFGLFISLYTLSSLFANFYLSVHQTKAMVFPIIAAIVQLVLILLYHGSIFEIIKISILVTFLLLISLMVYYPYAAKGRST